MFARRGSTFRANAADAERLEHGRLQWSLAVSLVEEDWPLLALREQASDEQAIALPDPYPATRHWAICRTAEGQRMVPLEPLQAKLMQLLQQDPLDLALARLERELGETPAATSPRKRSAACRRHTPCLRDGDRPPISV